MYAIRSYYALAKRVDCKICNGSYGSVQTKVDIMVNWKQIVEYRKHRLLKTTYIMLRFTLNKRVLIIVALSAIILSCLSASSQQVVTLKMCHESADSLRNNFV